MPPTALTDLEVDRVDAVDRPATRRKFLITKAEGDAPAGEGQGGDPVAEAKRLIAAAVKALGQVRKDASGIKFTEDLAGAFNELAKAVDDKGEEFAKSADAAPPADAGTAGAGAPAATPPAPFDMAALVAGIGEAVAKAVAPAVTEGLKKAIEEPETLEGPDRFAPPPASSQPAGELVTKSGPRKMGEGAFTNIIFGQ